MKLGESVADGLVRAWLPLGRYLSMLFSIFWSLARL
jgi:hypothetical protein